MEKIQIDSHAVKLSINAEEINRYGLQTENGAPFDAAALRRFLADVGFGGECTVEFYPSRDGGGEFYITKEKRKTEVLHPMNASEKAETKEKKKAAEHTSMQSAYSFDSLSSLSAVCRRLLLFSDFTESAVYCDKQSGRAYLLIGGIDRAPYFLLDDFSFLAEYGKSENADCIGWYLKEHASLLLARNAVKTFADF